MAGFTLYIWVCINCVTATLSLFALFYICADILYVYKEDFVAITWARGNEVSVQLHLYVLALTYSHKRAKPLALIKDKNS